MEESLKNRIIESQKSLDKHRNIHMKTYKTNISLEIHTLVLLQFENDIITSFHYFLCTKQKHGSNQSENFTFDINT